MSSQTQGTSQALRADLDRLERARQEAQAKAELSRIRLPKFPRRPKPTGINLRRGMPVGFEPEPNPSNVLQGVGAPPAYLGLPVLGTSPDLLVFDDVPELDLWEHTVNQVPTGFMRPILQLTFNQARPVNVSQNIAVGRNPEPVDGRLPLRVPSPGRMLSRTHGFIDVDAYGRILVTDYNSGNGINLQASPPRQLEPSLAYVVEPGTTVVLGDVLCRIDRAPGDSR